MTTNEKKRPKLLNYAAARIGKKDDLTLFQNQYICRKTIITSKPKNSVSAPIT